MRGRFFGGTCGDSFGGPFDGPPGFGTRRGFSPPPGFDPRRIWAMRHRHGRGFGPFGRGFMGGPGMGGRHFPMGRKLGSAELQLILLALLAERPSHGYELIKALEERSGGFYTPSPGMVYPALTYLEEVGQASVEAEGARKLYSITDAGREYLQKHRDAAGAILSELERIGGKMGRLREVFAGEEPSGEDDRADGPLEVWLARRELKAALREKRRVDVEEARRIAEVLKRAAAEIRGKD